MLSPRVRQLLVASAPVLAALSIGGSLGYPNILLRQLNANDTTITLDFETSSWIGSINGIAGIPTILMPILMQSQGRKLAFMISCSFLIIGWLLIYIATTVPTLLIAECFHSFGLNTVLTVSTCSIGEMIEPKYRSIFGVVYFVMVIFGLSSVGIIGQFLHWRIEGLVMLTPAALAFIITCIFWPESPPWLALKGRFEECRENFNLLRGDIANAELMNLLYAHKRVPIEKLSKRIVRRDFYIPSILMFFILYAFYGSGGAVIHIYFVTMVELSTDNQKDISNAIYVYDVTILLFTVISIILPKILKIKTLFMFSGISTMVSSLFCSVVSSFKHFDFIPSFAFELVLTVYVASLSLGLLSIAHNVALDLVPVKHRDIGVGLYIIYCGILQTTFLKATPYMLKNIDLWGTFLVFTANAFIGMLVVWKYVPETKNRTLQEIEDYFNIGKFTESKLDVAIPLNKE